MTKHKRLEYKFYYRRNLPHYQPEEGMFFVTYRLNIILPPKFKQKIIDKHKKYELKIKNLSKKQKEIEKLKFEKIKFDLIDEYLGLCKTGSKWLANKEVVDIIMNSLFLINEKKYKLYCFCIMPNHSHVLIQPLKKEGGDYYSLSEILRSHKGITANQANKILRRKGKFWHHESYDHCIRDEKEFWNVIRYILNNPVKANLVKDYKDWHYTWIDKELEYDLWI